jgi:hypothetical protein
MAQPTTFRWTKMSIWVGDGVTPTEDFTDNGCGLNVQGFSITGETSENALIDCADRDAPAWIDRVIRSLSSGFTGAGLLAGESFPTWRDWALSGENRNVRIVIDTDPLPPEGYFAGNYALTAFEVTGNEADGRVGISVTGASNGAIAWVAGAP